MPPLLQLGEGGGDGLAIEALQELPTKELLNAIKSCKGTATAADIAAASSLDIAEARRQLLVLARLVGAELQVSEDGELLFVFEEPGALRRSVRASSLRAQLRDAWSSASPPIFWLLRASFGLGLIASVTITTAAITVIASSSSKDNQGSSSSSGSIGPSIARLWGPSPFDFLYYSSRPYGYYGYGERPQEKGFLQSCFSLLFGDGDANYDLPRRTAQATARLIRANGGAVTAEQLAPLLAPDLDPSIVEDELTRPGAPLREDWMLPVLLQFGGEPVVTDDGDLVYIFPELMATAADEDKIEKAGGLGQLTAASSTSLVSRRGQGAAADYASLAAYSERPATWRPTVGDRVVVGEVRSTRVRRDDRAAAAYTGRVGVVVTDDRDALPFGVAFGPRPTTNDPQPSAFYSLQELLPVGVDEEGLALQELPQRFSTAPPIQLVMAGGLGAVNLVAVAYLGRLLAAVAGVPLSALGPSAGPMVGLMRRLYLPLLTYATGFVAVPAVRAVVNRRRNRKIEARNAVRAAWGRVLSGAPPRAEEEEAKAASDALSVEVAAAAAGRGGLRARIRRKLEAAKALRPRLRRLKRDGQETVYSSASSLAEQQQQQEGEGGGNGGSASLAGDGFDDFDARLAAAASEEADDGAA